MYLSKSKILYSRAKIIKQDLSSHYSFKAVLLCLLCICLEVSSTKHQYREVSLPSSSAASHSSSCYQLATTTMFAVEQLKFVGFSSKNND